MERSPVALIELSKRFLRDYVRKYPQECLLGSTLSVMGVALQVPLPLLSIRIIDRFLPQRDVRGLVSTLSLILALLVLRHVCYFFGEKVNLQLRESLIRDIQINTFSSLLRAPLSFFTDNHSGYLQSRVTADARMVEGSIVRLLVSLFTDGLTFFGVLACLVYINPVLAVLSAACLVPFAAVRIYANRHMNGLSARLQEETAQNAALLLDAFSGIRSIKLFGYEKPYRNRVRISLESLRAVNVGINLFAVVSNTGASFWAGVTSLATLGYGGYAVLHGGMTIGTLFASFSLLTFLFGPVNTFISANQRLQQSSVALKRLYSFTDLALEPGFEMRTTPVRFKGAIRFTDVSYSYSLDNPVLQKVNLEVVPGQPLGIVGRSGSGKSTLVGLLARLYETSGGTISIDGKDICSIPMSDLRSNIGFIDQVPFLFDGSIRDNLLIANPTASDEMLMVACRNANISDLVESLPDSLGTRVGERGARLSGGQAQRLCLARMFLKNPPIVILDEALSAVDTESEASVLSALKVLLQDRSTIMISHRLSSLSLVEKVVVLHEGLVVEEGTPAELMKSAGSYTALFGDQLSSMEILSYV